MNDVHSQDSFQFLIALLWPFAQEFLKNSPWLPWITQETKNVNRWMSVLVAAATTAGFHISGTPQVGWTLMIPPFSALVHIVAQWVTQQFMYSTTIDHPARIKQLQASVDQIQKALAPK